MTTTRSDRDNLTPAVHTVRRSNASLLSRIGRRKGSDERGYVMVTTAIVLPLLLMCVALAVDTTYYYSRGVELQRIADTAALAGVVRMPREPDAKRIALETATRNGAENGFNDIEITAGAPTGTNRRLRVTVRDKKFKPLVGGFITSSWDISRTSTAEYVSNIPLGSALNAIGTGPMLLPTTPPALPSAQNFWLSVAGPCAAKEGGDQISARYDGTNVNPAVMPNLNDPQSRYRKLCDWDAALPDATAPQRLATIATNRDATAPGLFPALSLNRDYDPKGYDYIVDVPCYAPAGVTPPAAPCPNDSNQTLPGPLNVEVFDPAFNPDSLRRVASSAPSIKPDLFGVTAKGMELTRCTSATPAGCLDRPTPDPLNFGAWLPGQVPPQDVRVTTQFRVYQADDTPIDTDDDIPVTATVSSGYLTGTGTEANSVHQFGSCINATDAWTGTPGTPVTLPALSFDGSSGLAQAEWGTDSNKDYVPDQTVGNDLVNSAMPAGDPSIDVACANNSLQWRNLVTIPSGRRGRYRINVRTVSAQNSFGTNSFSLRASIGPGGFVTCSTLTSTACPSVSGDSTMSVLASVPDVSDFYLAQLSPAKLYRNKVVLIQMWDPGEGGDYLEVLRPTSVTCSAGPPNLSVPGNVDYCKQKFDWTIWNGNINKYSADNALNVGGEALVDPCAGKGKTDQTSLSVAGHWNDSFAGICTGQVSDPVVRSRSGYSDATIRKSTENPPVTGTIAAGPAPSSCADGGTIIMCKRGRFNDRLVSIQVTIPSNYGCRTGTGTSTIPCDEKNADGTPVLLPQDGWWKVRYTPVIKAWNSAQYLSITDQTTWSVRLLDDPVHVVPNG